MAENFSFIPLIIKKHVSLFSRGGFSGAGIGYVSFDPQYAQARQAERFICDPVAPSTG